MKLKRRYSGGGATRVSSGYSTGDIIGTALDCDAKTITFYKNGVLLYTYTYTFSGPIFLMASSVDINSTITTDFGATPFKYSIPSGYSPYDSSTTSTVTTGITLSKTTSTINVNGTDQLTATITPSTANQTVNWSSSDTTIATVDSTTGIVTARNKAGTATITATTTDGSNLSAPCVVTVTDSSTGTGTGTGTGSGTNTGTTTGGGTGTGTVSSTDRAMLIITMSTGVIKQYDLSANDVNAFLTWYDAKSKGTAQSYYVMPNATNIAPYLSKKDYIPYDKIDDFQVDEYKSN